MSLAEITRIGLAAQDGCDRRRLAAFVAPCRIRGTAKWNLACTSSSLDAAFSARPVCLPRNTRILWAIADKLEREGGRRHQKMVPCRLAHSPRRAGGRPGHAAQRDHGRGHVGRFRVCQYGEMKRRRQWIVQMDDVELLSFEKRPDAIRQERR
jgi:hypothetical protein